MAEGYQTLKKRYEQRKQDLIPVTPRNQDQKGFTLLLPEK
jgi:hypothetical protein